MKRPIMETLQNAIEIENLSHRYAGVWALSKVTAHIRAGEIIGVLGPNGCGKTTLLKILATRLTPTAGSATLLGLNLKKETEAIRKKTKWLGHDLGLYKALTAEENLKFFARVSGLRLTSQEIEAALDYVRLKNQRHQKVAGFSIGMKKRLSLARILLEKPEILFLDEPHTNLDQDGKKWVSKVLMERKKEGCTILFSSHDHPETIPLCDKILALNEGTLTYFGPPEKILKDVIL